MRSSSRACLRGLPLLLLCLALPACQAPSDPAGLVRTGDLLFQDTGAGPLAEAIKAVTQGYEGAQFSHVGIAVVDAGTAAVIEASGAGVKYTPLGRFLARSADDRGRPRVVVGRLKPEYQPAIAAAVERARQLLGKPYNDAFLLDNGKYYCSELVYEVFRDPATGHRLFEVGPMTFCPPGSKTPLATWRDYFARKGMPIPEGLPGCNPGGLSRSERITIVCAFGRPAGWSEADYRRHAPTGGGDNRGRRTLNPRQTGRNMAGEKTFRCEILTPEATLLAAEAESVVFPAADGLVGVLPRRAPLAAVLGKGQVTVRSAQGESRFQVKGGVAHMQGNALTILAKECTKQ